jgi:hypothetical protein
MKRAAFAPLTIMAVTASLGFFHGFGMGELAAAPAPSSDCTKAMNSAAVEQASKVAAGQLTATREVSLGDTIGVSVVALADLQRNCIGMPIVLYLNGYPINSLKSYPPVSPPPPPPPPTAGMQASAPPASGELRFILMVGDEPRDWVPILGKPGFRAREIRVSVGLEGQYPLRVVPGNEQLTKLKLDLIANKWFIVWGAIFLAMLAVFFWCVRKTNIIRDGNPATSAAGVTGTYSLSKSQGAMWFFVILAAYLFIGLITGDFVNSINSTALILLGIGAGTVIGSAVIDQSKDAENAAKTVSDIAAARKDLVDLNAAIAAKEAALNASPTPPDGETLRQELAALQAKKDKVQSDYRKLTRQNEQFLTDILSDANGVSFHRFQMAAWTLVLGIVFIKGVYDNLAMPEFDTTLMGLLGLSAGTYLGLKIPEATTPTK